MAIAIETVGRRVYLRGETYSLRHQLRNLGAHWDADHGAWWVGAGKRAEVQALIERAAAKAAAREAALPPATSEMVPVRGDTYPIRDQLRELGGRWDGASKTWLVPASRLDAAKALLPKRAPRGPRAPSGLKGEAGPYQSRFEADKHDRTPRREIGESCWLRHDGQRIAVVVVGFDCASWLSSDLAEDMGHYGLKSGYYGTLYYRAATQDEFDALQATSPREDGVCAAASA